MTYWANGGILFSEAFGLAELFMILYNVNGIKEKDVTLGSEIVADFAIIMTIAAIVTYIFHRLKQPLILGYLVAGVIIGPYTPPFSLISRIDFLGAAADMGVILLLFAIGLEFPLARLRTVGKVSIGVAAIEIAVMFLISYGIGAMLGWSFMDTLFLGAALASSSTVIIAKVLTDFGKLKDTSALIMMGVLIVEDLFVVGMLAVITSIAGPAAITFTSLAWDAVKILVFLFVTLFAGSLLVPRIINRTVRLGNSEVLVLITLGLCFGLSVVANRLGFSMAIGAFLMGVLVASAKSAERIASLISPLKDMFAAMFFVSIGALMDITQFQSFLVPALIVTLLMIVGKMLGCGFGTRIFGYDTATSLKVGLGMTQIGEFAFIVMKVGQDLNAISPFLFPTIGVAAAITTFLTPYLIKLSYRLTLPRSHLK
jgi:CPA2 family monovalent cation:H+ antiporter-2